MLARTCGPPRNPVWAATNRRVASVSSTNATIALFVRPSQRVPTTPSISEALSVFPATCCTPLSMYPRMIPPATNESERAMYNSAFFPVFTRGSRSVPMALQTASIPV